MKKIGISSFLIGIITLIYALSMSTTVTYLSDMNNFGKANFNPEIKEVHNIGLMQKKSNFLMLGGILTISGVLLIGFSRSKKNDATNSDSKKFSAPEKSNANLDQHQNFSGEKNITNPKYQLFLTDKFNIVKNNTLDNYVFEKTPYKTLNEALIEADHRYCQMLEESENLKKEELEKIRNYKRIVKKGNGICPGCDSEVTLNSNECPVCRTRFIGSYLPKIPE
jgi:zona occludens toxin (predicted ATPase)